MTKQFDQQHLDELTRQAGTSPRLRMNYNLHPVLEDPVQRLCNAMEPGTYVRPHRHPGDDRWELFTVLRGRALVLVFDEGGQLVERHELSTAGPNFVLEMAGNTWHSIVSLEPGTVLFEVKQGPYQKLSDKDFAQWAPLEGGAKTAQFIDWFTKANVGDRPPSL